MTEAAHQIASNPLPPGERIAGSVGFAAGAEIAVVDDSWHPVAPGVEGEIAIRGATVIDGYRGAESPEAFRDGWFRTGDLGAVDTDGRLTITGRVKEVINRGGETINPAEIEAVLLRHPTVADAAVFAIPHEALGETVGCCVVLSGDATPRALQDHVAAQLARSRVPARVWIVDEVPTGPTGKVQRSLLGRRFSEGDLG